MPNRRKKLATKRANNRKVANKSSAKRTYADYTAVRLKPLARENWRRASTKAGKRIASMLTYVKKHPRATVKEIIQNTAYRSDDFNWDVAHEKVQKVRVA